MSELDKLKRDQAFNDLGKAYKRIEKYINGYNKHHTPNLIIEGYSFEEHHHPKHDLASLCISDNSPHQLTIRFRWDKKPKKGEEIIFYSKNRFSFIVYSIKHSTAMNKLKEELKARREWDN